ncbi:MAG: hypoxanthine phosphoribosyltransferase [Thermoproteota archaeon]|jgi:hypoxanthine phosphoribosyltransferase
MEMYTTEVLISEEEIAQRVNELGQAITKDYANEELVVICVLKGAFMFCSDLIKKINIPINLEFVTLSSYGTGTVSTGEIKLVQDITGSIEGKHVLVVEDIVDTGLTINYLNKVLADRNPKSVKLASLLHKATKTKFDIEIDYLAFEVQDKFVVGYGLDYAGRYRELPYIGILNAGH